MGTLILINISYSWNCVFFSILSAYNYLVRTGKAEIVLSEINAYSFRDLFTACIEYS